MDEEIERLVIGVRADTQGFRRDVAEMRASIDGPLQAGADRAGRAVEAGLARAIRNGRLGFEELGRVALSVMAEIAAASVRGGLQSVLGGGAGKGLGGVIAGLIGAPGRATGGPVSPGRAYTVGERGPELFVPTASGRIETGAIGGGREVNVAIRIDGRGSEAPAALARSGRQVARAVRAAVEQAGG